MAEDYVWIPWDSILEHCEHVKPIRDVIPEFYVSLSPSSPQGGSWQLTEPTIDNKVYSFDTSFTPTQSGSGTPSHDNVRPIVGRTEVLIHHTAVNVWDEEWESGHLSSITGQKTPAPTEFRSKNYIPILPNTTYYSNTANYTSNTRRAAFYDADKNYLGQYTGGWIVLPNGEFTTPSNAYYMRFYVATQTYNNDISINYPSTDLNYHAYTGHTTPVPLGQTVYGGTLDVTNGELTVTHGYIGSYNGETIGEPWLSSMDVYEAGTTPTTGAQVAYPLATPTTVQLSPTEIELFLGQNNIWSDTGENVHIVTADDEQTGMIVTVYGKTLWMRNHIFYKDGTDEYTTPIRIG